MRVPPRPLPTGDDRTSDPSGSGRRRRFGIVSTYPPTPCGLATFSAALADGLRTIGHETSVLRLADGSVATDERVAGELVSGSAASLAAGVDLLDECDVAVVQHEYGVYGGTDGDEVIDLLGGLHVPAIVVAHTVLRAPTPHQRTVLVEIGRLAGRLVVMSGAARERVVNDFDIDPAKVATIPHGAALPAVRRRPRTGGGAPLLTWGLLGPGKGIERVIDAVGALRDRDVLAHYLVAGRTHPKVRASDGEAYRLGLMAQARRLGVSDAVSFDADYRDVPSLTAMVQSALAVVLPYDSADQVTSGVLVDAIAAGRPVIATAFPHAVELLASGAGIVVDHDDPDHLTRALHAVLTEPGLAASMAAEAERLAPGMGWPVVAQAFADLGADLTLERSALV